MAGVQGWSCLEWLTVTGWKVELDGSYERVRGSASKGVGETVVRVSGEAETLEDLAWTLVESAAATLEAAVEPDPRHL